MRFAVILSGGTGSRVGGAIPKQYVRVGSKTVLGYCLETAAGCTDRVCIVASEKWRELIENEAAGLGIKDIIFAAPGETRQLSVYNGLRALEKAATNDDGVIICDAARPLASRELFDSCFKALSEGHDGAMPVLPMKDTVYFSDDGRKLTGLTDRKKLFAGQAPEAFLYGKYREANDRLLPDQILKINGSSEPAYLAGMDIALIPGDERNFKITTVQDLEEFKKIAGRNGEKI